jgi:hypothetical protein
MSIGTTQDTIELRCVKCGDVKLHSLPENLDFAVQQGRDFSNYHRWCGGGAITRPRRMIDPRPNHHAVAVAAPVAAPAVADHDEQLVPRTPETAITPNGCDPPSKDQPTDFTPGDEPVPATLPRFLSEN